MHYTFIVNPNARSGLGYTVWSEIEAVLKARNISYDVYFTKYQRHASQIAQDIAADTERHTLIVLGGDGTVNEVINGIPDYEQITLGYIPIGSSNDFARYFHFPKDPLQTLEIILKPEKICSINVGILKYPGRTRSFAVSTGIGFDAAICHEAVISKLKFFLNKLKLGRLTYVGIAFRQLMLASPGKMTVTLDQEKTLTFENALFATAMNHPFEGGGCKFCPKADPCDNLLDVIVVAGISKLKVLLLLPTAFSGFHVHFKGVYLYRCKEVSIDSEKALAVHTDGEPAFLQKHISAALTNKKIRIIAG